jgi:hypothetical protein
MTTEKEHIIKLALGLDDALEHKGIFSKKTLKARILNKIQHAVITVTMLTSLFVVLGGSASTYSQTRSNKPQTENIVEYVNGKIKTLIVAVKSYIEKEDYANAIKSLEVLRDTAVKLKDDVLLNKVNTLLTSLKENKKPTKVKLSSTAQMQTIGGKSYYVSKTTSTDKASAEIEARLQVKKFFENYRSETPVIQVTITEKDGEYTATAIAGLETK